MIKKILNISLWIALLAGLMVVFGFAARDHKRIPCSGLSVLIKDNANHGFINENDIRKLVQKNHDTLEGQIFDSINSSEIETLLRQSPYLKNTNVIKTLRGEIIIESWRYQPKVKIITSQLESFYLSEDCTIMPLSSTYVPHLLIASGNIPLPDKDIEAYIKNGMPVHDTLFSEILFLTNKISSHPLLNMLIGQIFINKKNKFELIPTEGSHCIVLGKLDNLDEKIENLLAFYQALERKAEKPEYREINLEYKNQVVCKK